MIHNLYFIQHIQPAQIVHKQIAIFSEIYLNISIIFWQLKFIMSCSSIATFQNCLWLLVK